MTNRTEELKKEIKIYEINMGEDVELETNYNTYDEMIRLRKAELKGRQEMRDEIRDWLLNDCFYIGGEIIISIEKLDEFDAKFGDKNETKR